MNRIALILALLFVAAVGAADSSFDMMVRQYNDGETQVITPHVSGVAAVAKDSVEVGVGYAEDIVTSASTDVRSWSSSGKISDTRREESAHVTMNLQHGSATVAFVESDENDYHSHTFSFSTTRDFFEKNTTLDMGVSYGINHVGDSKIPSFDALMYTDNVTVGVTQVLSPVSIAQLLYDFTVENGYLSSPYRVARVLDFAGGGVVGLPENSPLTRNRHSLSFKYNRYSRALATSFASTIRGYTDSWGVDSGTLEERMSRDYGKHLSLSLVLRAYYQSSASFYNDIYDPNNLPVFITGNKTLSNYYTGLAGLRPTFHFGKDWELYGKIEYYLLHFNNFTDVGNPLDPADDKPYALNAVVYGAGLSGTF